MTRAGCRRGTIGQIDGGVGGVVFSAERTVDSVIAKLAIQAPGVLCPLFGIAGIPIGFWIADGSGSAFCPRATFKDRADGTEFTVGTTTASNIQIDVGSSLSWSSGITPLAGVLSKIVLNCMGACDPTRDTTVITRTTQTVTPGTLVANEFFGAGSYMEKADDGVGLVMMIGEQYSAGWRARPGFNVWPTIAFTSGTIETFDPSSITTCIRIPKTGDVNAVLTGDVVGDTEGPSAAAPTHTPVDGWGQVGRTCVPSFYYGPGASDLVVNFENIQVSHDGA